MKWSEQMRVLQSEDEHYNQLELDTDKHILTLNGEFLVNTTHYNDGTHVVERSDYKRIIKKYPFFNDKKLLLGCIFKAGTEGFTDSIDFSKTSAIKVYTNKIIINAHSAEFSLEIHTH